MPAAVIHGRRLAAVLGTMGGSAQPQILAQVLYRLSRGDAPQAALDAPRWILGDGIHAEAKRPRARARRAGTHGPRRSTTCPTSTARSATRSSIAIAPDGSLTAASDPRSEGGALVVTR